MSAWFLDSELSTCYYYNHVYQFGTGGLHRSVTFNENKAITFLSFNTTFAYNYVYNMVIFYTTKQLYL